MSDRFLRAWAKSMSAHRIVGEPYRFGFVFEAEDGQYRPEHFFSGDAHLGFHVGEDSRLNEQSAWKIG